MNSESCVSFDNLNFAKWVNHSYATYILKTETKFKCAMQESLLAEVHTALLEPTLRIHFVRDGMSRRVSTAVNTV